MTCTAYAIAASERDIASYPNPYTGRIGAAHSIDELIAGDLDGPIAVTVNHDDDALAGVLVFAELNERGELACVTALADWVADYPGPLYYSAEMLATGPGVRTRSRFIADAAALTGLSVTNSPARIGSQPLRILRGDCRSAADRGGWEMSWRSKHHPVLERCVDSLGPGADRHLAARVVDRRAEVDREMEMRMRTQPLRHSAGGYVVGVH